MAQSRKTRNRIKPEELAAAYAELDLKPGAGLDEVKKAHRRLARALHPDRNPGAAGQLMGRVNRAYQILLNHLDQPETRRAARRAAASQASPVKDGACPVPESKGGRDGLPLANCRLKGLVRSGGALVYQVEIEGRPDKMTLPLRQQRPCRFCNGSGVVASAGSLDHCTHCGGRGSIVCAEGVEVALPGDWRPGQRLSVPGAAGQMPVMVELSRSNREGKV